MFVSMLQNQKLNGCYSIYKSISLLLDVWRGQNVAFSPPKELSVLGVKGVCEYPYETVLWTGLFSGSLKNYQSTNPAFLGRRKCERKNVAHTRLKVIAVFLAKLVSLLGTSCFSVCLRTIKSMAAILELLGIDNPLIHFLITRCLNGQNVACTRSKEI